LEKTKQLNNILLIINELKNGTVEDIIIDHIINGIIEKEIPSFINDSAIGICFCHSQIAEIVSVILKALEEQISQEDRINNLDYISVTAELKEYLEIYHEIYKE